MPGSPLRQTVVNPFAEVTSGAATNLRAINIADYADGAGTWSNPYGGWKSQVTQQFDVDGTGTISVAQSFSPVVVTGVGTAFLSEVIVGDWLHSGTLFGRVQSIASNTSCTVETWVGTTQSGAAYKVYHPSAIYIPGTVELDAAWVVAYPYLHLFGDGSETSRILCTGTGIGLDARVPVGSLASGLKLSGFSIEGNANITELLYTQNISRMHWHDILGTKAGTNGFRIDFTVGSRFSFVRYSENEIAQTVEPAVAILIEDMNACKWSGTVVEGLGAGTGVQLNGSGNKFDGGTIEGNVVNLHVVGGNWNRFSGIDFEDSAWTTHSVRITGGDHNGFVGCDGIKPFELYQSGAVSPTLNYLVGGQWLEVEIGAGCYDTHLALFDYTTVTDSGVNTTRMHTQTGGTRLRDPLDVIGRLRIQKPHNATTTVSGTGLGTGSAAIAAGSSDSNHTITLSPTGVPAATGFVTVTFAQTFPGAVTPVVVAMLKTGTGAWETLATVQVTATAVGSYSLVWYNNGVALTAGQTYQLSVHVIGR